ncbi:MAG: gene transfer agent family protein [Rhizobiales bacterium]|nr:gene transfer agent family protein [Hyphomicrobiales bacterium]
MASRHGAVELDFADGTYTFRLALDQIEELERKRDLSIFTLAQRLDPALRTARLGDITEVIRLGLIGGGMTPVDALAKVRRYVDERPIDESRDTAYAIVLAGLMRVHGDEVKASGEAKAAERNGSTSPPSEEPPS